MKLKSSQLSVISNLKVINVLYIPAVRNSNINAYNTNCSDDLINLTKTIFFLAESRALYQQQQQGSLKAVVSH